MNPSNDPTTSDNGESKFADAGLKIALQRTLSGHRASGALRASVSAALELGPAVLPRQSPDFWRSRILRVAVAACVVLGAGGLAKLGWDHHIRSQQESFIITHQDFLESAVRMFAASDVGLNTTFPVNIPAAELGRRMSAALGRQIVIPDARDAGWTVTSAGIADIGAGPLAYVYFRNQSRSAAMIVFPSNEAFGNGKHFDVRLSGHRVGGVSTTGGLHTFVTRPCQEGETDDMSDLISPVADEVQ